MEKAKALGQFLRFSREKLSPLEAGVPGTTRRRTPGLRREEVAEQSGISTAWYTYLEQGREVRASLEVLDRIADTLGMTEVERQYLHALARPDVAQKTDEVPELINGQKILDNFGIYPALYIAHQWDIVGWNRPAANLFTDFGKMDRTRRNLVLYVFTDASLKEMYEDWQGNAKLLLAQFRMGFGLYPNETRYAEVIGELLEKSPEFAEWWNVYDVQPKMAGEKNIYHRRVGKLKLAYTTFQSVENPRLTLMVYNTCDPGSEAKLAELDSEPG
ncbi:MAG TPA: helix-turn-helix transcriptional regulator [Calditrichia bacterium]|nr:helix-turn-helix transcriptional regulator [Calditrichia bacterium]HQV33142.1 helix-turn-helix transcriptional regulator [Calditrichia bacterium]